MRSLSVQKRQVKLALKFLHRYVSNIYQVDYLKFAKQHSGTGSSCSVREARAPLEPIQEEQLEYGYLCSVFDCLLREDPDLESVQEEREEHSQGEELRLRGKKVMLVPKMKSAEGAEELKAARATSHRTNLSAVSFS